MVTLTVVRGHVADLWMDVCCVLGRFCYVRLFATPWTVAHQTPLSIGFFRREHVPSSRGSSQSRDQTRESRLLHWKVCSLRLAPPGKPLGWVHLYHWWCRGIQTGVFLWHGARTMYSLKLTSCKSALFQILLLPLRARDIFSPFQPVSSSLRAQLVKNPPAMQETWVRFLDQEDPLEKG